MTTNRRIACLLLGLTFALVYPQNCHAQEPVIVGSARFTSQINQALLLLKRSDKNAYAIVLNNIGRIQQGERSGMSAYKTPPTYEVNDATAFYSLTWCAATIAHDSFHSKLYHDYQKAHKGKTAKVPDSVWTGTAAEKLCMRHQIAVMKRLGASQREIDYAKKQSDGHYVKDRETWADYKKRKW